MPKILSVRRISTRRPRLSAWLGYTYRGGGVRTSPTRFTFSWETAAQRWRSLTVDLGFWRFVVALRSLGPGPLHG